MKNTKNLILGSLLVASSIYANEKTSNLESYLNSIKIDNTIKIANVKYDMKGSKTYATGIGGFSRINFPIYKDTISFELAPYFGVSLNDLSGDNDSYESSLTSKNENFMTLGEANLNIKLENGGIIIGRQIIDTPLMGDDDLRLTNQTFEGVMANYSLNDLTLKAGYFTKWQGFDAGILDVNSKEFYKFQKIGTKDTNGVTVIGLEHSKSTSFMDLYTRAYYYDIDNYSKVSYLDMNINKKINENISADFGVQYTKQNEQNDSNVEGELYGLFTGLAYDKFYLSAAYTKSKLDDSNTLFNGFGGEFYFTAMNEYAMGYLTVGEDEKALSLGLSYDLNDKFNLSMYTTTFKTKSDKVQENDLYLTYSFNENLVGEFIYANIENKKDDNESYDNFIYRVSLTF